MSFVQFVLVWIGLSGAALLLGGGTCGGYSLASLLLWGWMPAVLGLFCAVSS